jgi:hypothetical protein
MDSDLSSVAPADAKTQLREIVTVQRDLLRATHDNGALFALACSCGFGLVASRTGGLNADIPGGIAFVFFLAAVFKGFCAAQCGRETFFRNGQKAV